MRKLFLTITAIQLLLLTDLSFAQTELRYEHYTIANGMSSNFTKAIEQDLCGLLWIGTIDGLNCFNGYDFTTYFNRDNDSTSLSENSINDLLVDKKGILWIATNNGLNKYIRASNNFQRFLNGSGQKNTESLIINRISVDPDGNLWLGTDKGIRILNPDNNTIHIPQFDDASLTAFVQSGIAGIFFDSKGVLWLGSSISSGFRLVDKKTLSPQLFSPTGTKNTIDGNPVSEFYEDKKGVMWILSGNGLYSYQRESKVFKRYTRSDAPNDTLSYDATSLVEDPNGDLWVSLSANPPYYTSIAKVDRQTSTFRIYPYVDNDDRGLAWSWASFVFRDTSGIYWVGTSRGLDKMDPLCQQFKLFQPYTNNRYNRSNNIYCMIKDDDRMWLGTDGVGLIRYDLKTKTFEEVLKNSPFSTNGIYALLKQPDGTLLVGTNKAVYSFNPRDKKMTLLIDPAPLAGNGNTLVSSIAKGEGDMIWIGLNGGGLLRYNMKSKEYKLFRNDPAYPATLQSNQVNVIFLDSKKTIWVGSADGVNVFGGPPGKGLDRFNPADETFTHFSHLDSDTTSLSGNNVICIAEDKQGMLWIGTRNGGLNRFDRSTGKFKRYTKSEGMPSNFITAIEIDGSGKIWTSSFTNGLACLDPTTGKIKVFDNSFGLQNMRFNRHASFKSDDDELFFGGVSGFNSFYPEQLRFNTKAPDILITGIDVNNKPYSSDTAVYETRKLRLTHLQSEIQFEFTALNYSQTFKNQYAYKLEGYDHEWIMAGAVRNAKYTNLDPGDYTFKVKASNNDGVWNETGTSVFITILPPWWKTWWAYSIYLLVLVGSIFSFIAYRSAALLRKNKKLEDQVAEKTNDLEEKNKELVIESSLERTRRMATGMKTPEDLLGICETLFSELQVLGFSELRNTMINIHDDEKNSFLNYDFSDVTGATVTNIVYNIHPVIEKQVKQMKRSTDAFSETIFTGKDLEEWKEFRKRNGEQDDPRLSTIPALYYYFYSIGIGSIGISSFSSLTVEKQNVLKRFRNVFDFAYRRYMDVSLAEAQTREAQIEVSLERVRSRTLAMHKSDELAETSAVVFKQLINLGIEPNRLYIAIVKDETGNSEFWITDEDGSKVSSGFKAQMHDNPSFQKMFEGWKEKKKSLTIDMQGKELEEYFHHLRKLNVPFKEGLSQKRRVQNVAYFSQGFIGIASPELQPEETTNLLERFASVFNLTYARFNDLTVAEHQAEQAQLDLVKLQTEKKRAEDALSELRSTQAQLIQSEKMASLGELTAGIAHEIQNPLNFINNFSEVNTELIEELKEEKSKAVRDEQIEGELLNDISNNLEKITHHGKRADAIVKGMLLHSRNNSGQKEPTDINALADEYLRLSYHGLRAKDKSFNAYMKTDFDKTIGNIQVVPQEIGRVILNLINNAFYAVADKKKQRASGYEPTVWVTTKKAGDKISVSVKDNGNGIPQKVLDKIFQPFFTTKETGQGTGLGLSLSYDIIKAHSGELKVETKEGEMAEFIIQLPI